jgi:hypothetical protein
MHNCTLFFSIFPFIGNAEIYKCVDEQGKTVFSQQPCGDSSEIVTVKPIQSSQTPRESVTDYSETLEEIAARTDIKMLEHRISRLNGRKRSLEKQKSTKLSELRKKRFRAYAGDSKLDEDSISEKILEVEKSYTSKIKTTQDKINDATRKLNELRLSNAKKDRPISNYQQLH